MLNESSNEDEPQQRNRGIQREESKQPQKQNALQRMFSCFKPRNKNQSDQLELSEMRPSLGGGKNSWRGH